MLEFSRKKTPQTEPCDVTELIADAIRFVQPYLKNECIDVRLDLDRALPRVPADRWQIGQALVNLFQNAADAMARSEHRVLSIGAHMGGNAVRIAVSDTGPGIPPRDRSRVFDPFFTTKGDSGAGLGLHTVKRVVDDHGGVVDVETGDRGTTIVMTLPV